MEEKIEIDLTKAQREEHGKWLVNLPSMRLWFKEDHEAGFDFSYLEEPEIEDGVLKLEVDGHLLDNIVYELDRLIEMHRESYADREMSKGYLGGVVRSVNNLLDKIFDATPDEIVEEYGDIVGSKPELTLEK